MDNSDEISELRRAEAHVFAELLKRGVLPYRATEGGFRVNTAKGNRLALLTVPSWVYDADGGYSFAVGDFQPSPDLFFLCVESDDDAIGSVWVFPSISFFVYAEPVEEVGLVRLNLDAPRPDSFAETLREYVSFFRDRWEPVVQFDYFRRFMPPVNDPNFQRGWEDFEDILMLMEFSESRDQISEERIPVEPPGPESGDGQRSIALTPSAKEDLDSIPTEDRDDVLRAIRSLADNPTHSGSIRLEGGPGNYRVRRIP